MLGLALLFFLLAIACGVLGFSGIVVGSLVWVAKVCFVLFIILFLFSLLRGNVGPPAV